MMNGVRADLGRWRARAKAALDALTAQPQVNGAKLAAIGYCFGGSTALELGRSGAALAAIVSFHGGLESPKPEDAANIKAKVLVCHGADDPLIPPTQVTAFEEQMRKTRVDWQLHIHGGAVHSFTNPDADKAGVAGLAYNAAADRRSWKTMLELFAEAFGEG
jgi:dienelactone hydrolase